MIESLNKKKFDFTSIIFIAFFCSRLITKIFSLFFGVKGVLLTLVFLAVLYLIGIIIKIKEKDYSFLAFFVVFFGLLFLTAFTYYRNKDVGFWLADNEWGFFIKVFNLRESISALLVILLVNDKDRIIKDLVIVGYINAIYLLIQIVIFYKVGDWSNYFVTATTTPGTSYNMNLGYDLIFVSFIMLTSFLKNPKNKLPLVIAIFSAAFSLVFGSRGVLVLMAAYIFIYCVFFFNELKKDKRYIHLLVAIACVAVLSVTLPKLNKMVADYHKEQYMNMSAEEKEKYKEKYGELDEEKFNADPSARTIEMLKGGEFFESNGRTNIWKLGLDAFKDSPIYGKGVFGDRPYVGTRYTWGYSHNIAVELASNFGIFGIAFGIAMVYLIIYTFIKKDLETKYLYLIFVSMLTKLLLSDSLYFSSTFWAVVGLLYLTYFNKSDKYKTKLIISLVFLVLTGLSSVAAIKRDYNDQSFDAVEFNKPTIAIGITGYDKTRLTEMERMLDEDENLKYTFFKDPKDSDTKAMITKGYDVQDYISNSKSYTVLSNKNIVSDVERSNKLAMSINEAPSDAIITPYYSYNSATRFFMRDMRLMLIDDDENIVTYSNINDANRLNVIANRIELEKATKDDEKDDKSLQAEKDKIDNIIAEVKDNDNFALMDFVVKSDKEMELLKYAIQKAEDAGVEFTTIGEIADEARVIEEDVDLKDNLKKNSKIMNVIFGIVK